MLSHVLNDNLSINGASKDANVADKSSKIDKKTNSNDDEVKAFTRSNK